MLCEKKKIDSLVWPSWILILLFSDINSIILDLNRRADTLRTHVQQEHMQGAVLFQCEQCPYSTEKKQSLHHHKRTVHSAQEQHYCDQCGKNSTVSPDRVSWQK